MDEETRAARLAARGSPLKPESRRPFRDLPVDEPTPELRLSTEEPVVSRQEPPGRHIRQGQVR